VRTSMPCGCRWRWCHPPHGPPPSGRA
jgi:hypothetical protein